MKIAIASENKNEDSEISLKGGRAPYYLLFEDKELVEVIRNPFAKGSGGAGFSVAHMLAEKDVKMVVAGKIGGNMESALNDKNIELKEESGKINKFLENLD